MEDFPVLDGLGRPLVFGEVLVDVFPDGSQRLGGAPFNVAWHLQGFGLAPLLITRIGADLPGERIIAAMSGWGMDTQGVQTDPLHPTGQVHVELHHGQPSYTILPSQAYDFIDRAAAYQTLQTANCALLYHGTLSARTASSHQLLQELRAHSNLPVFVDINLRSPWWTGEAVATLLNGARWAKMNDHELAELVNTPLLTAEQIENASRALCQRYELELLVLTLGADGASFSGVAVSRFAAAPPVEKLQDTVGAGDAFSAVCLLGLLRGWPDALTQQRALEFASAICTIAGATHPDVAFYQGLTARWVN